MEFSTDRRIGAAVLLAVIILLTPFGVSRSLSSEAAAIEKTFYDGVYNKELGYTEKSIQSHLDNRINAANGLISMTGMLSSVVMGEKELSEARVAIIESDTIAEKFEANQRLTEAAEKVLSDLSQRALPKDQQEMLEHYKTTLEGSQNAIDKLTYNDSVDEFNNVVMKSFPVSLFDLFISVDAPESFR